MINLKAGLNEDFKTDIPPDGVFEIPSAYLGTHQGDTDDGSNIFKRWFFRHKAPIKVRTDEKEPHTQMAEQLMGLNHDLASWGVDAIQWDYGWWPGGPAGSWRSGEGDWRLGNPGYIDVIQRYPGVNTWQDYGQYLKDQNLTFTVYFLLKDAESEDPDALSSIGPNGKPEWFTDRDFTAGRSADLGNEDAVNWIKNRLLTVMNENHIDTFRSDFEPIPTTSDKKNRHRYETDVQFWNAKGFYEILDHLHENKAGFRYENNGSGGSLKDYATLSRSTVAVYTDSFTHEDVRKVFYTSSYAVHPAQLLATVQPDDFSAEGNDDYGWRSIFLAGLHIASPGTVNGHLPYEGNHHAEKYYGMFRDKIRPLVRHANLYHILPRPDGIHWDGVQYFDPDITDPGVLKGAAFIFKPSNSEGSEKSIYFKGLSAEQTYDLEFEDRPEQNTSLTGQELMDGLEVSISEEKGSEIIWIK